jgi:inorganic pyrophosphatase
MNTTSLARLKTWDAECGDLTVIVETPKGTRSKLDYEPELALFKLSKILPMGTVFPFDFGFVPSTLAEDGDPLDVLIIMDEPLPPGCVVGCRLLGIIEANQEKDGKAVRNDRLVAAAQHCKNCAEIHSLRNLDPRMLQEIEHFFVSYNEMEGKVFRLIRYGGPRRAKKAVRGGQRRFAASRRKSRKAGAKPRARATSK